MFKQRLLAALVLIPVFVYLLLFLSPSAFGLMTLLLVLVGGWEWTGFMGVKTWYKRLIYVLLLLCCLPISLFITTPWVLWISLAWWCFALVLVLAYPHGSGFWGKGLLVRGVMGVMTLIPTWRALNFIRDNDFQLQGTYLLLFLFIVIWGADTGAYFAGKLCGKNKLLPLVSPGKTWEGLAGAVIATLLVAGGGIYASIFTGMSSWKLVLLVLITMLFSVLGDLFESMLKRNVGLKDSGVLIPGHGGLLDRIDSLTAGAPIFALGLLCFSHG